MKLKQLLAFTLLLALLLVGCGPKAPEAPKEPEVKEEAQSTPSEEQQTTQETPKDHGEDLGGVLLWNIGAEPGTWDPQLASMSGSISLVNNVWEGLVRDTSEGIKPALAQSWDVKANAEGVEGTVYTFHLRDNLKWSDGTPLVAQEFVDSWMRAIDPANGAAYAFLFTDYIVGAEEFFMGEGAKEDVKFSAPDEKTLVVELKAPVPYFLNLVSFCTFFPTNPKVVGEEGWEKEGKTCLSNGPFVLEEYNIGSHILLKKNEHYWDADNVKLQGIKLLMIAEASTALQGYQSGEIQILDTIPQEEIPKLMAEDPNFVSEPAMGTMFYSFNMDIEPTNNLDVRKALTYAVDRKAICDQVLRGGQLPAAAYVPPGFHDSKGNSFRPHDANGKLQEEYGINPYEAQVDLAKEHLALAGYPNGEGFPELELFHDVNENNKKIAEAIQEMWTKNLGIKVKLRSEEWKVFASSRYRGEFTVCRGGWGGDYNDPMTMFDLFTSQGINYSQWRWQPYSDRESDTTMNPENKQYEDELKLAMASTGEERDQHLHEAEKILIEQAVIMPLYYNVNAYIVDQGKVTGVQRTPMGSWDFRYAALVD